MSLILKAWISLIIDNTSLSIILANESKKYSMSKKQNLIFYFMILSFAEFSKKI